MSQEPAIKRHRRGDPSAVDDGLFFLRYSKGREVWVPKERLDRVKEGAKKINAKQRAKPEHKEKMKLYFRDYNHSEKSKTRRTSYYKQPEVRARYRAKYAPISEANKAAKEALKTPEYLAAKKEARSKKIRDNHNFRYENDPSYRMKCICKARIADALKCAGVKKTSKSAKLIGCSFAFFRGWIESKFERGMSWHNFGVFWED